MTDIKDPTTLDTLRRFLVETLTGIAIFTIIASAAVVLSWVVTQLERNGIDSVIVLGLRFAEYAIFLVDLILFSRFLWVTGVRMWKAL